MGRQARRLDEFTPRSLARGLYWPASTIGQRAGYSSGLLMVEIRPASLDCLDAGEHVPPRLKFCEGRMRSAMVTIGGSDWRAGRGTGVRTTSSEPCWTTSCSSRPNRMGGTDQDADMIRSTEIDLGGMGCRVEVMPAVGEQYPVGMTLP